MSGIGHNSGWPADWVELGGACVRLADDAGHMRVDLARRNGRRHINGWQVSEADELRWNLVACRAELAAARFYGLRWVGFVDGDLRGLADIGGFIDVKAVENDGHCLLVPAPAEGPEKLIDEWAYVLVWAHYHPRYAIVGWRWGFEIRKYPVQVRVAGRPARFIPRGHLYPAEHLFQYIRMKAAA